MSDIISQEDGLTIRRARADDIDAISAIDEFNTGIAKTGYWRDTFERYGGRKGRYMIVAESDGKVAGFVVGEVRAWEFGSPPCGWIFAVGVDPNGRLKKVGSKLYKVICDSLRDEGVDKVRTMLKRDDSLNMAFFRSQGMMGGPFIQLEMPLD